jgi:HD-GYP domain-containing protein (c-di-GMP phosphodiesterase class II)
MRLVPLRQASSDAVLGREVVAGRGGGAPLLRAGAELTPRVREVLARKGVHAVFVDDELSRGIFPTPVLPNETRAKALGAVASAFDAALDAQLAGRVLPPEAIAAVDEAAARIVLDAGVEGQCGLILADLSTADGYMLHHAVDSAALGVLIGRRMLEAPGAKGGRRHLHSVADRLTRLAAGLLLADIGKLALPASIVDKPGQLSDREWQAMATHTIEGLAFLKTDLVSPLVKAIVRSHHERWDGRGYPDAKPAAELHLFARIAAVADVYDAITSERVYSPAAPAHAGVRAIREGRGTAFDPEVVDEFCQLVAPFPPGALIELTDGRGGVVAAVSRGDLDRPVVRVLGDGEPYDLPLADHPHVRIRGWEDMDPAPAARHWLVETESGAPRPPLPASSRV